MIGIDKLIKEIHYLYNFRGRSYWLRRIKNCERKEHVPVNEYSIEHSIPQNKYLSLSWQNELGKNWQQIYETLLHTPSNLTLSGSNSKYCDQSFAKRRDMQGGFKIL